MIVKHNGINYECAVAVRCDYDKYIKLYDAAGVEIIAFNDISDFSDFEISGGSFIDPCNCFIPIPVSPIAIGGRTIHPNDWILSENLYHYIIENEAISANETTCNVFLSFAENTQLDYIGEQRQGQIVLFTPAAPLFDVVIDGILVIKA